MKLAVISTVRGYPWAGSEELWLGAAMEGLKAGATIRACLHRDLHAGEPLRKFRDNGGELREWRMPSIARMAPLQDRFRPNFSRRLLGNADHLLVSTGSLPSLLNVSGLVPFLLREEIPYTLLVQFNADCLPISPWEREVVGEVLAQAAGLVFVSRHNLHLAERQFNLSLEPRAEVMYNPIRTSLESPLPMPDSTEIRLACVARFETLWKGQDLLVEILSQDFWRKRRLRLRFYGEGPDKAHVKSFAQRLPGADRIEFPGYVRDLESLWSKNHVMILPSRGEGTPLAALEAMMCGRPVVTTDVGGNREVIRDRIEGFIADAATPHSFGATLERAWSARNQWKEMGAAAHERAQQLAAGNPALRLWELLRHRWGGQVAG